MTLTQERENEKSKSKATTRAASENNNSRSCVCVSLEVEGVWLVSKKEVRKQPFEIPRTRFAGKYVQNALHTIDDDSSVVPRTGWKVVWLVRSKLADTSVRLLGRYDDDELKVVFDSSTSLSHLLLSGRDEAVDVRQHLERAREEKSHPTSWRFNVCGGARAREQCDKVKNYGKKQNRDTIHGWDRAAPMHLQMCGDLWWNDALETCFFEHRLITALRARE